jgi:SNF2 family DNA or RNA helicase
VTRALWNHQKLTVQYALEQKGFGIFHEPGTGKTGTTINIMRHLFARVGNIRKTLILSPLVTLNNWAEEFCKFSTIDPAHVLVLEGTGDQKWRRFVKFVRDQDNQMTNNRIVIANYEAMQNKKLHLAIMGWRPEILVCDESHRVKNPRGKRAEQVCKIADQAAHKYILTGTPILNSSQDVFFQYRIMDGGATFGDSFWAFRNKYFVDKNAWMAGRPGYFPDWQERTELRGEISRKMYFDDAGRPRAHRVEKKECIDLPPMVKVKIKVELSPDQRKMYDQMKDEFLTYVEELKNTDKPLAVVANMAVTKALRLQQITCGFVKAEDGNEYPIKDNPRLEALKDLLEDTTPAGKVIVWCMHGNNAILISNEFAQK